MCYTYLWSIQKIEGNFLLPVHQSIKPSINQPANTALRASLCKSFVPRRESLLAWSALLAAPPPSSRSVLAAFPDGESPDAQPNEKLLFNLWVTWLIQKSFKIGSCFPQGESYFWNWKKKTHLNMVILKIITQLPNLTSNNKVGDNFWVIKYTKVGI